MTKAQDINRFSIPLERRVATRVGLGDAGLSVLEFLCRRFDYQNPRQWVTHLEAQRIRVNQGPVDLHCRLSAGDTVEFRVPQAPEPPVNRDFSIVFENDDLLAVDKPANLPCHPAGPYFRHTLWGLLKERGLDRPLFAHRIDRETSGIVLVAKHISAIRHLRGEFEAMRVHKRYLTLVEGRFPRQMIRADGVLYPDPDSPVRKKRRFALGTRHGISARDVQYCRTVFKRIGVHGDLSLVEALPATGRAHQIRASLQTLGFPVVGDKLYGRDDGLFLRFIGDRLTAQDRKMLRIGRHALHAAEIRLRIAPRSRLLCFCSPLPPDLAGLLAG